MKIFKFFIFLTLILNLIFMSLTSHAITFTKGFYLPSNNGLNVWGFEDGFGTNFEQNSPGTNPDLYCSSRGDGYRLPKIEELSHQLFPVNSTRNYALGRAVGSSVFGEWGYLTDYPNTSWSSSSTVPSEQLSWNSTSYWVEGSFSDNKNRRRAYIANQNSDFIDRTCSIVDGKSICQFNTNGLIVQKFAKVACIKDI